MDTAVRRAGCTIHDIYALPEGKRAELIDGELYMMAAPGMRHQWISGRLFQEISNYMMAENKECRAFAAPFAVFLNADESVYLEPDISVICDKNKLTDKGCSGAPDWIIEIVSASSRSRDYFTKLFQYRTAGVREYWIVDYTKNRITAYNFENTEVEIYREYTFSDSVKAGIYENLVIDFSNIDLE